MRRFSLIIFAGLLLGAPRAFAIQSILNPCERLLEVAPSYEIHLETNQIALQGHLTFYWEQSMGDKTGWVIVDEFLRSNITPNKSHQVRWLRPGDELYLFDSEGKISHHGFYGETHELTHLAIDDDNILEIYPNVPRLYRDKELTQLLIEDPRELRHLFVTGTRAVAVQTLEKFEFEELQTELGPWFERYELNKQDATRFVKIGRLRAIELANFQILHRGPLRITTHTQSAPSYDIDKGIFKTKTPYYMLQVELAEGDQMLTLNFGDYIYLLDAKGLVTLEGVVGSKTAPIVTTFKEDSDAFELKLRAAKEAVVLKPGLRPLL